ncbi:uracil-DNA glycosylase [Nitrosomonas supralitoralis]|uniref:Type-5 uracil-DNA glycosylase n=1 Tax=Nitrosomonas supralitoralis TaxID=2116706 RepID=A0A2P7NTE3_9PROT|nr:uracil-DNA glycosylase [Nitrosomonas supralitoralis]PSJ16736.1 SPO1 DNA polymerase [Nitrosomonas supralitoralis]
MTDVFSCELDQAILNCQQCSRLSDFLQTVKIQYPDYHARPVIAFGDAAPKLLIVGLAPGMHGANRTGRPFTGDFAGILLYQTLHRFGFATRNDSVSADDGLQLVDCRITNAVKCLPPENKPIPQEIRQCNQYLSVEINQFVQNGGIAVLVLGTVAHQAVLMSLQLKAKNYPFGHGAVYAVTSSSGNDLRLYDSYHCSRYNTQTKRLTAEMFSQVFAKIVADIKK